MNTCIIAEKPSVARDIARIVRVNKKNITDILYGVTIVGNHKANKRVKL